MGASMKPKVGTPPPPRETPWEYRGICTGSEHPKKWKPTFGEKVFLLWWYIVNKLTGGPS